MNNAASSRRRILQLLLRDQCGVSAMLLAVTLPVLLLFGGLAIDTGAWFTTKRQIQSAADAAALSAAYEVNAGNVNVANNLVPAATEAAAQNFYTGNAPAALTGCTCPAGPNCSANGGPLVCYPYSDSLMTALGTTGVEVVLNQPINATLASWAVPSVTIAVKAVAIVKKLNEACILALSTTGTGIGLTGNYSLSMPNCTMGADSTSATAFDGVGNGCITAYTLVSPGEYSFTGNSVSPCASNGYDLSAGPYFGAATIANPYAGTLTHTFLTTGLPTTACAAPVITATTYTYPAAGNCVITSPSIVGNYTVNLSAGTSGTEIAGGLSFIGNGTINLSPGTYWITDGSLNLTGNITLDCPNCSPGGAGVTIIFTTTKGAAGTIGTLLPTGNVSITLNAPGSGTYAGYLMLQDTVAGATYTGGGTVGNAGSTFDGDGLLYFPSTDLTFVGNIQTASNCLVAIANQFSFTGNIGLASSGCPTAGLTVLPTLNTVALAE
jgi:Flp pilus assembly protein TadG